MSLLLGIDIGGTSVKLGLVTPEGQILDRLNFPTQSLASVDLFFQKLTQQIQSLLKQQASPTELIGIGIGAPGHSLDSGIIIDAVNLPFSEEIPIGPYLEDLLKVPCFLIKDSKAAALGEKRWGAGRKENNFVLFMLGTGLGYAACVDGRVINGYLGLAGEYGHVNMVRNGRKCNCGKKGCVETYVSATGLKRTAFILLGEDNRDSLLRDYSYNQLSTSMIAEMAQKGDPIALEAFNITGQYLGIQMANLTEQLTPRLFLIAGGLAESGELLLKPARETLRQNIQPVYRDRAKIQLSELGSSEVGILGAAALALENIILHT